MGAGSGTGLHFPVLDFPVILWPRAWMAGWHRWAGFAAYRCALAQEVYLPQDHLKQTSCGQATPVDSKANQPGPPGEGFDSPVLGVKQGEKLRSWTAASGITGGPKRPPVAPGAGDTVTVCQPPPATQRTRGIASRLALTAASAPPPRPRRAGRGRWPASGPRRPASSTPSRRWCRSRCRSWGGSRWTWRRGGRSRSSSLAAGRWSGLPSRCRRCGCGRRGACRRRRSVRSRS